MANYKLEIHKIPSVEVVLVNCKRVPRDIGVVMTFDKSVQLQRNDLIWAESDMSKNDTKQMLVIRAVMPSGKVRLKRPEGEESLEGLREFKEGEKFKVVASFVPTYEQIKPNGKIKGDPLSGE